MYNNLIFPIAENDAKNSALLAVMVIAGNLFHCHMSQSRRQKHISLEEAGGINEGGAGAEKGNF